MSLDQEFREEWSRLDQQLKREEELDAANARKSSDCWREEVSDFWETDEDIDEDEGDW